jgi:hypothetical protein
MASKWSKFRDKLPAFENESSFQEKVNEAKEFILAGADTPEGANVNRLARLFSERYAAKKGFEEIIAEHNIQLEALSQLLVERLEESDTQKVELSSGATIYLQDTPYPGIEDETKFYAWLHKEKLDDLLTLNHQTLKGIVSERLQQGKPLPSGTKCYLKTQARVRGAGSSE